MSERTDYFEKQIKVSKQIDDEMMILLSYLYGDGSILVRVAIDLLRDVRGHIEKGMAIKINISEEYIEKWKIKQYYKELKTLSDLKEWVRLNFPGIEENVMSNEEL